MLRFLRYNSRHRLWFPGDWKPPQLNPLSSSSHSASGRRTFDLHEPLWFLRLRQRLFAFAGNHRCGRRDGSHFGVATREALPDTWAIGPDGNRTCSYCGSIHADDLMAICRKVLVDDQYSVDGTDKGYKFYVRQPGVMNAGQGAIKFYTAHVPDNPSKADQELFASALRVSRERWAQRFARQT